MSLNTSIVNCVAICKRISCAIGSYDDIGLDKSANINGL